MMVSVCSTAAIHCAVCVTVSGCQLGLWELHSTVPLSLLETTNVKMSRAELSTLQSAAVQGQSMRARTPRPLCGATLVGGGLRCLVCLHYPVLPSPPPTANP